MKDQCRVLPGKHILNFFSNFLWKKKKIFFISAKTITKTFRKSFMLVTPFRKRFFPLFNEGNRFTWIDKKMMTAMMNQEEKRNLTAWTTNSSFDAKFWTKSNKAS